MSPRTWRPARVPPRIWVVLVALVLANAQYVVLNGAGDDGGARAFLDKHPATNRTILSIGDIAGWHPGGVVLTMNTPNVIYDWDSVQLLNSAMNNGSFESGVAAPWSGFGATLQTAVINNPARELLTR